MIVTTEENSKPFSAIDSDMEAMMEAGVHMGHARSKRHPAMAPFVWGVRADIEIIDLVKTKEKLEVALAFIKEAAAAKRMFLIVGTRPSAKNAVRKIAEETGLPYVNQRWIGGTLTNFKVIRKRIENLEAMEQEKATGGFDKYTKKERLDKEKEMSRLEQNFGSLRRLQKLPEIMIVVDISQDDLALREARRMSIPVVALTDTNTDPRSVTYAIPSNDDARSAIEYMLERIGRAILAGHTQDGSISEAGAPLSNVNTGEIGHD